MGGGLVGGGLMGGGQIMLQPTSPLTLSCLVAGEGCGGGEGHVEEEAWPEPTPVRRGTLMPLYP